MNHYKVYANLCISRMKLKDDRLLSNQNGEYFEKHHIKLKSLGGNDSDSNIVLLTAREHFIAHSLLAFHGKQHYSGEKKLKVLYAHYMMSGCPFNRKQKANIKSKEYESIKKELSKEVSKKYSGRGNPMWKRSHSLKTRQKISRKATGRSFSEETRYKISKSMIGKLVGKRNPMYGISWDSKKRKIHSLVLKDFFKTEKGINAKLKMSESHRLWYSTPQGELFKNRLKYSMSDCGNPRHGKSLSESTKFKISTSIKEKCLDPVYKENTTTYTYKITFPDGITKENLYRCDIMKILKLNRWEMAKNKRKIICRGKNKDIIIEKFGEPI